LQLFIEKLQVSAAPPQEKNVVTHGCLHVKIKLNHSSKAILGGFMGSFDFWWCLYNTSTQDTIACDF